MVRKQRGIFERPRGSGVWWVRYTDQYRKEHREKVGHKERSSGRLPTEEDGNPAGKSSSLKT